MKKKRAILLYSILLSIIIGFSPILIEGAVAPATTYVASYDGGLSPMRIAVDSSGRLYVTDPSSQRVLILSNSGNLLSTINGFGTPSGIAVDSSGRIYVGYSKKKNVGVFDLNGKLLYKLGSGDGEVGLPNGIAISSTTGKIYVIDSEANKVKVYYPDGSFAFSFGGEGSANGKFSGLYGIAINNIAGEVIVSDWNNANNNYARIQIFDFNGTFKASFRTYTSSTNYFTKLQGLTLDKQGRIYVADTFQFLIQVFDRSGISLGIIGTPGTNHGQLYTPMGVAIDPDNKLFITSYNTGRIEVYGLDNFNALNLNPLSMSFKGEEEGSNPPSQMLSITNSGNGTLDWTATTDQPWLNINPSSGKAPTQAEVSVNLSSLMAGTYKGVITIATATGIVGTVPVELTVNPSPIILNVSPLSLSFKAQYDGNTPPPQKIYIANIGAGTMNWSASADQAWISLNQASGSGNSTVSVTANPATLSVGTYNGKCTVTAPNAQGSPKFVDVSLRVIYAGTVKVVTNLAEAGFDITPIGIGTSYSGTGTEWSYDEVEPGDYAIMFKHVSGYIKPPMMTFTVKTGREVVINGEYRMKPVATHIIAGAGGAKGKYVAVLPLDKTQQSVTFEPFKTPPVSVRIAAGDLDGSGIDKIVVTDYKKTIMVYTSEGVELASLTMPEWYENPVIAVKDIDNDGAAEIIAGAKNNYYPDRIQREIKLFRYNAEKKAIEEKYKLFAEDNADRFNIALGDINGDGIVELIMADKGRVRAYNINLLAEEGKKLSEIWAVNKSYIEVPEVAAGDINDDDIYEIALSTEAIEKDQKGHAKKKGTIRILKGTGEDYGIEIDAFFGDLGYEKTSRVAMGDIDGDNIDEIIAGTGDDVKNEALIRTFESDGTFTGTTIKAMESMFGVNVSSGRFK